MLPVTKPYIPNKFVLRKYLDEVFDRQWFTNNGQLVQELTSRLENYLGVENLLLVSNGTLALQVAYRTLGVSDAQSSEYPEAITTPFTFIATASSLKWDGVEPVFSDINSETWCLSPKYIEQAITPQTRAILPVHVFGNACAVEGIQSVADKHDLKVVYDASHAFGVNFKGESLLKWGDAATLSFHATKLFHTAEGGAIVFKRKKDLERAKKIINFGITGPESIDLLGINAKMNELQAAMGLCVLDEMEENLAGREKVWNYYAEHLEGMVQLQKHPVGWENNFAYFPVVLESEVKAENLVKVLREQDIVSRRYFYPSLDTVECLGSHPHQPVSNDIASRIVCLPIFYGLEQTVQDTIIDAVKNVVADKS